MPTVSVITPVFNCKRYLSSTIESVQRQTFEDWEMILVDDCSTDGSFELAKAFSLDDSRIRLIQLQANSGAAVARNAAIEAAHGRYIAFLDSDDLWLPQKLERQLSWMNSRGAAFAFSAYEKIDELGNVIGRVGVPEKIDYAELLKTCIIGCLTAIYDVEAIGKVEMPLIRKRQDWGLWLRILRLTPYAYGSPEVLARYRVHQGSISANKISAARYAWRLFREVEGLSLPRSCYSFAHYAARGVLRNRYPKLARRLRILV